MKKLIKRILIVLMCISMLFTLSGCFKEPSKAISDVNATYYIGDTVTFDDYTVCVNNVQIKKKGTYIDSYYYIRDPEWIAVTLTYTNTSDKEINLNRYVRLINSKGEILNTSIEYYHIWNTEYLTDSNLIPNGSKTGFLQFANTIADNAEDLTLQVSGSSSFSSDCTFTFKLHEKE